MKRIILTALSVLILITGLAITPLFNQYAARIFQAQAQTSSANNFLIYQNLSSGISIQYPSDWLKTEVKDGVVFQSPSEGTSDKFREQIGISVTPSSSGGNNKSSAQLANQEINKLKSSFPGFQLIQTIPTRLTNGSTPAHIIVYTYKDNALGTLKAMKVITLQGAKLYKISYFAQSDKYDIYLPTIQKMIDSFHPTNALPSSTTTTTSTTTTAPPSPTAPSGTFLTYENSTYGIKTIYPSNWSVAGGNESGIVTTVATISSPYDVNGSYVSFTIYILDNSGRGTNLEEFTNSAIGVLRTSYDAFKLIERNTNFNNTFANNHAYTIIGTYNDPKFGTQKIKEVGTLIGNKAYLVDYVADLSQQYAYYLPTIQRMIDSFQIVAPTAESQNVVGNTSSQIANFLTYDNPFHGFKLQYPSNWTKTENNKDAAYTFDSGITSTSKKYFSPDVTVFVLDSGNRGLGLLVSDTIDYDKGQGKNFELLDSSPITINGKAAHKIVYTYRDRDFGDLKLMEVLEVNRDKLYDIVYTTKDTEFDQFLPLAQKMIDSFQVTK